MFYIIGSVIAAFVIAVLAIFPPALERKSRNPKTRDYEIENVPVSRNLLIVPVIIWAIVTAITMTHTIPAGHVGVKYQFRDIVGQTNSGLNFTMPWQSITAASTQYEKHRFDKLNSFSKETQDVMVTATINTQVTEKDIQQLFREVGPRYFETLVVPRVLQAFKDETVKYRSVDIAPNREQIRHAVRDRLTEELRPHSIIVRDLLIDNIEFSKKFQDAIEEKQAQTQLALAEKEKIDTIKYQATQALEKARGEGQAIAELAEQRAKANKLLNDSLTPALIQYTLTEKLAPNVQVIMLPSGQPMMLNMENLAKGTK